MLHVKYKKHGNHQMRNSRNQFQLRCVVENVPAARRQFLYLLKNYTFLKVQKDDVCHMPPDDHEQLEPLSTF